MTYVQIIEFTTTRIDEIQDLVDEWMATSSGRRTAQCATLLSDRERPGRYLQIVEFPSGEAAMENSALPETSEFAERAAKLVDSGPAYGNFDVHRVDDLG